MEFGVVLLVGWVLMIGLGMFVSGEKGRGSGEGCLLALLFGPFGILIAALLPSKAAAATPLVDHRQADVRDRIAQQDKEARREAFRRFLARVEAVQFTTIARWGLRRTEKREAYLARGITPGPFAWLESISLSMIEWYKNASDIAQLAVWVACMAIPAAALAVILFRPR